MFIIVEIFVCHKALYRMILSNFQCTISLNFGLDSLCLASCSLVLRINEVFELQKTAFKLFVLFVAELTKDDIMLVFKQGNIK